MDDENNVIQEPGVLPTQLHRGQAPRRSKELPNECLYKIIGYLESDKKSLYTLLFVSRQFFGLSIRLLFRSGYPQSQFDSVGNIQAHEMILELAFISFLQTRIREFDASSGNQQPSQIVEELLGKFGLRLTPPHKDSKLTIQQKVYGPEEISDANSLPTTTIDYSTQFTQFRIEDWTFLKAPYLQLCDLPMALKGRRNLCLDPCESQEHTSNERNEIPYLMQVQQAIVDMWTHYNYQYITDIAFTTDQAHKFLPYATKFSSLSTLTLDRGKDLYEIQDTLTFITLYQSAFPMKKPLDVEFASSWDYCISDKEKTHWIFPQTIDFPSYVAMLKHARERILGHMRPMLAIYEAVKSPKVLSVYDIPNFYSLADKIQTDRIVELRDGDNDRFDIGEREPMEAFLQRCENLRILSLGVSHPDALSWVFQNSHVESRKKSLMKLEELNLRFTINYLAAIAALKDAMNAFAPTLKIVSLRRGWMRQSYGIPNAHSNILTWRALQLQKLASSATIGDFPLLLPHLTSITISATFISRIDIGSLDNCPNLEYLEVEFGDLRRRPTRPKGDEPTSIPDPEVLLNPNWRHPAPNDSLFPKWNLPKLKRLILINSAAMRFDFESLPSMQQLEELTIEARSRVYFEQDIDDYVIRQQKITLTQTSTDSNTEHQCGIFGTYSHKKWSIPTLSSIRIKGPPVTVFCLEFLRFFPALKSLTLDNPCRGFELRRNQFPIHTVSENQEVDERDSSPSPEVFNDAIFFESQLRELNLINNIGISGKTMESILTIYAPFLEDLDISDLVYRSPSDQHSTLVSIIDIQNSINRPEIKERGSKDGRSSSHSRLSLSKSPGPKLTSVYVGYTISDRMYQRFKLQPIELKERGKYRRRGKRVYVTLSNTLVHKEDIIQA
ncbi:hypothetical protein BGZ76_000846 [Entomortierella beljakovae]|nr:hypothetical protein BGZ76_000846 [Entomortierella beljakovae]